MKQARKIEKRLEKLKVIVENLLQDDFSEFE